MAKKMLARHVILVNDDESSDEDSFHSAVDSSLVDSQNSNEDNHKILERDIVRKTNGGVPRTNSSGSVIASLSDWTHNLVETMEEEISAAVETGSSNEAIMKLNESERRRLDEDAENVKEPHPPEQSFCGHQPGNNWGIPGAEIIGNHIKNTGAALLNWDNMKSAFSAMGDTLSNIVETGLSVPKPEAQMEMSALQHRRSKRKDDPGCEVKQHENNDDYLKKIQRNDNLQISLSIASLSTIINVKKRRSAYDHWKVSLSPALEEAAVALDFSLLAKFSVMALYYSQYLGLFFLISAAIRHANACLSSGVCGGGCCQPPCPPPPQPTCNQASCQPGYSCGHFGCARNRARSALTRKDGLIVPVDEFVNSTLPVRNIYGFERKKLSGGGVGGADSDKLDYSTYAKLTNPNYLFRQCCEDRRLPDACLSKCHFNTYTKQSLQEMFFKNDPCPIEAASDLQYCAAQGRDHVSCCHRNGIHTTLAGEKCLTFCDQRAGRVTKLDYSYLPCYDRFENMKRCFYDEIKVRMESKLRPRLKEGEES
ncbi:DB module domain-containing protein [Ditylenchus destructor]|nr:DB module domain-containing protein [Ditylenchus destructor]